MSSELNGAYGEMAAEAMGQNIRDPRKCFVVDKEWKIKLISGALTAHLGYRFPCDLFDNRITQIINYPEPLPDLENCCSDSKPFYVEAIKLNGKQIPVTVIRKSLDSAEEAGRFEFRVLVE